MFESPIPPEKFQVSLLRDQVSDLLRDAIVKMQLKPGQRLVERELVTWTGVSRATVREAIRQLEGEGLVKIIPQKGAVVAVPTPEEAEQLYELRAVLEGIAGRRFTERATAEQKMRLRETFEDMRRVAEESGETWAMLESKSRFYAVLFEGAANPIIQDVLAGLQARITVLRATSMSQPGRPAATVKEIGTIVEAIEAGDAEAAERACSWHVQSAAIVVVDALALFPDGVIEEI